MKNYSKSKIINDPIYGFITIPTDLVFQLIEHPYFQRLRRISQMGMSSLVYPGARHTRFHHALGSMFLMQKAVRVLRSKNIAVSFQEEEALYLAILLHDIGHGPFSHAMEFNILKNIGHEAVSLKFMEVLNAEFDNRLKTAIAIFKNEYPRRFFHQLVSGQLDMDRLDYLKRDSFYTGVPEGTVNAQRIIAMLNVSDDRLVLEEKAIYSVENFLVARRLMYWQVYLHKTGVGAEQLLVRILRRVRFLLQDQFELPLSNSLGYFLKNEITAGDFNKDVLEIFSQLDDTDVLMALKQWSESGDFILNKLCKMLLHRNLLKVSVSDSEFAEAVLHQKQLEVAAAFGISAEEASYFVFGGRLENQAYSMEKDTINLLRRDGSIVEVAKASDQLNLEALSKSVVKYYMCFPKNNQYR